MSNLDKFNNDSNIIKKKTPYDNANFMKQKSAPVRINAEYHKLLKLHAVMNDTNVRYLVDEAVKEYIDKNGIGNKK